MEDTNISKEFVNQVLPELVQETQHNERPAKFPYLPLAEM